MNISNSANGTINLFKTYITGSFDNQAQIDEERKNGQQIHPLAVHINAIADDKITDAPSRNGFWLLEESYYTYPEKPLQEKPYLFFFEAEGEQQVHLHVYKFPENIALSALKNANKELTMRFEDLKLSPTFKGAIYTRTGNTFSTHSPNDLGNGMTFTLTEKFTKGRLEVMELVEKNGKRITPYDTPIIYLKK